VGRLDRATTGALLFTTDGDLAHAVRKPWHRVPKHYLLDVTGDVEPHDPRLENLVRGVDTALGTLHVERVTVVERPPQPGRTGITRLRAVLVGGKNRQLRRMCYRAGLRLLHLHRDRFGPIHLGALAPDDWRPLTGDEVDALWASVGGRDHIRKHQLQALARRAALAREQGAPMPRLERWLDHPPS
jgi:pseudouridine synthase